MNFIKIYSKFFKNYFPSPFTIAIILSVLTFFLALFFTNQSETNFAYIPKLSTYWFQGLFKSSLLAFTVHMMLILVLGHVLALSKPFQKIIELALYYCTNTSNAVFIITFSTILVSMFNWGLGLIFGAIFARKIGEHFKKNQLKLNYPLVGASAYVGLMVWHGGISGSAPLTIAGDSHSFINEIGSIPLSDTIFSSMNIFATIALLVLVPCIMAFIGKKVEPFTLPDFNKANKQIEQSENTASEFLENKSNLGVIIGLLFLMVFAYLSMIKLRDGGKIYNVLNLQTTNLLLFGMALVFHRNINNFLSAIDESISDVSGILIQFPLYFGIMGIMQESGLAEILAEKMTQNSTAFSLPIYTYISAGLVNLFVPSGGGQWQIQAPIIIESAKNTGVSISKMVMALSYGDQLTNMLQPFWAIPLLGITGLKAKNILPFTLILFVLGAIIFLLALVIF